jgi:purine-nucleoside phosphorylase
MTNPMLVNMSVLEKSWYDVKTHFPNAKPFASFILGSGWADAAKTFNIKGELSYDKIGMTGSSGIAGQHGKLIFAEYEGKEFFLFDGRRYFYEGLGWTPVSMPVYITKQSGAKILFLSSAVEGITYEPGDLMIVKDHINSLESSPLVGPHHMEFGIRFPDMSEVYDHELVEIMNNIGKKVGVRLVEGIFRMFCGPSYETPAEKKYSASLDADVSGMSTVPEAILGHAMGLKVAAIACVGNYAAGRRNKVHLSHESVLKTLNSVMGDIQKLFPEMIKAFAEIASK